MERKRDWLKNTFNHTMAKNYKKGISSNQIVSVIDILPTIIDIAGGKSYGLDGKSFLSILKGKDKPIKIMYMA